MKQFDPFEAADDHPQEMTISDYAESVKREQADRRLSFPETSEGITFYGVTTGRFDSTLRAKQAKQAEQAEMYLAASSAILKSYPWWRYHLIPRRLHRWLKTREIRRGYGG